jgi:phosphatidyl-myo-inositol dimannoside synthase
VTELTQFRRSALLYLFQKCSTWSSLEKSEELAMPPVPLSYKWGVTAEKELARAERILLLTPSLGFGGGIERYLETIQWAIDAHGTSCQRIDLSRAGIRAHARMLAQGQRLLRTSPEPVRLVVGHRSLLPVATLLARESSVRSICVLCYGQDVWDVGLRPRRVLERRLMRRRDVRVVAISGFTAGALGVDCHAAILPPALSQRWFDTLVAAASAVHPTPGFRLATAFRLADWRQKGLPQLLDAVAALGRNDLHLTICGSGDAPADLLRLLEGHSWCTLRAGLTDGELAEQFAAADLFVLATRTSHGRHASGEGFGLVLIEAQLAGTAVIAPAHGGSWDAYVEGVTGVAPADETAEALARVLDELLANPARLALLGKRAADWARESFAPERYVQLVARRLL